MAHVLLLLTLRASDSTPSHDGIHLLLKRDNINICFHEFWNDFFGSFSSASFVGSWQLGMSDDSTFNHAILLDQESTCTQGTKIKGSCKSGRKVVTYNSDSDLPLVTYSFLEGTKKCRNTSFIFFPTNSHP